MSLTTGTLVHTPTVSVVGSEDFVMINEQFNDSESEDSGSEVDVVPGLAQAEAGDNVTSVLASSITEGILPVSTEVEHVGITPPAAEFDDALDLLGAEHEDVTTPGLELDLALALLEAELVDTTTHVAELDVASALLGVENIAVATPAAELHVAISLLGLEHIDTTTSAIELNAAPAASEDVQIDYTNYVAAVNAALTTPELEQNGKTTSVANDDQISGLSEVEHNSTVSDSEDEHTSDVKINDFAAFPNMTLVTLKHHGDITSKPKCTLLYSQKYWELYSMGSEDARRCLHSALADIATKGSAIQELLFVAIFANSQIRRITAHYECSDQNFLWGLVRTLALKTLGRKFGKNRDYLIRVEDVKGRNNLTKPLLEKSHGSKIGKVNGNLMWGHGEVYNGKTYLIYKSSWSHHEAKFNNPESAERAISDGCGKELPTLVI